MDNYWEVDLHDGSSTIFGEEEMEYQYESRGRDRSRSRSRTSRNVRFRDEVSLSPERSERYTRWYESPLDLQRYGIDIPRRNRPRVYHASPDHGPYDQEEIHIPKDGSKPGSYPKHREQYLREQRGRAGFGVPSLREKRSSGVRIKGCPTCGYRCQHVKRHFQHNHLPGFHVLQFRDHIDSTNHAKLVAEAYCEFLHHLAGLLGFNNDDHALHNLLALVRSEGWYPDQPNNFNEDEIKVMKSISQIVGEDSFDHSVSPPSTIAALTHWRIIAAILNYFPSCVQEAIKAFRPRCLEPNRSRSEDWSPELLEVNLDPPVDPDHRAQEVARYRSPAPSQEAIEPELEVTVNQGSRSVVVQDHPPLPAGFDSHFHLDLMKDRCGAHTLQDVLDMAPCKRFQLKHAVAIYCYPDSYPSSQERVHLRKDERLYFAYGIHPKESTRYIKDLEWVLEDLQCLCMTNKVVALGEVGLDYASGVDREHQQIVLGKVLPIAVKLGLPVIIHCRDKEGQETASWECLQLLVKHLPRDHTLILHSFNGSLEKHRMWKDCFKNTYFSFSGLITRPRVCEYDLPAVITEVDESYLLLETDSPHLTPRGLGISADYNTPSLLEEVASVVARYRNVPTAHILTKTTNNACRCFRLT